MSTNYEYVRSRQPILGLIPLSSSQTGATAGLRDSVGPAPGANAFVNMKKARITLRNGQMLPEVTDEATNPHLSL